MWRKTAQSPFRDRTQEFQMIAERLKKSVSVGPGPNRPRPNRPSSGVARQSELNLKATEIGFKIRQTSQKVARLAKLAKRTPVSNDPTTEILKLTENIKGDITALNSDLGAIESVCKCWNEGGVARDATSHLISVVADLKSRLFSTTKEFRDVLTKRAEETANPFVREGPLSVLAGRAAVDASLTRRPLWSNRSSPSPLFPRKPADGESQPLLPQNQQQHLVPVQDSYMQSRAEALKNIDSTIHELGHVYNQLATLVSQQGEIAIRIDDNMDDALARVEGAQGALLKYLNGISSDGWLMIKIVFVLIFFLIVYLIFLS